MKRVVAGRLMHLVPVLLLVSLATMLLLDLAPGDPAIAIFGDDATPDQIALVQDRLDLDEPISSRYGSWLGSVLTGDFGVSFRTNQPVWDAISERLPVTLEIALLSIVMALAISIPLGIYTSYRADGRIDRSVQVLTSLAISSPSFLTGVILAYLLAVNAGWFPVTGWVDIADGLGQNLRAAFLPALTLATTEIAIFTRLLRSDMIATLQEDYILTAKAKGLSPLYILFRHALRPSSFSLLTLAGLALGRTLGGAIIVEYLFALPGIGNLLFDSIQAKDFVMVQGVVLFVALCYVAANTFVDLSYNALDPRVREARR